MSDPIIWYESQRSTVDMLFASVDPTLPAPWRSVMDESGSLVFYWNPETNVSQYEHPNPAPPPPPHPPPDHYQIPYGYKPTFPYSSCTYRPPDYPASYIPELFVAPTYTSPIFLPHTTPPSFTYSYSIDIPQIPNSYATNPNFHDPHIYFPSSSSEQDLWVSNFNTARDFRRTSKKTLLKSVRVQQNLVVVSLVRVKRKPLFGSPCRRRYRNRLISSLAPTPPKASANSTTMGDDVRIKARKQEEFQFRMAEFRRTMTALNNQQAALQEALMEEIRLLRSARVLPNSIISTIEAPRPSRSAVTFVFTLVDSNGDSACQSTLNYFNCSHNSVSKFRISWLQPEDQDDTVNNEWYGDHRSFKLQIIHLHEQPLTHIKISGPEFEGHTPFAFEC